MRNVLRGLFRRRPATAYADLVARVRTGSAGKGSVPRPRLAARDVPLMFW
ncbi:MAG TPA: hypothetical protein VGO65_08575 [Pseudolysinimonas sp.]|jgi:hypothetical protein|nr:hypothetical protein [Pseudolysinimonas sp.]